MMSATFLGCNMTFRRVSCVSAAIAATWSLSGSIRISRAFRDFRDCDKASPGVAAANVAVGHPCQYIVCHLHKQHTGFLQNISTDSYACSTTLPESQSALLLRSLTDLKRMAPVTKVPAADSTHRQQPADPLHNAHKCDFS